MGTPFFYSERNGTERNDKKGEQNDLAEGPHSRTERNRTIFKMSERAQPYSHRFPQFGITL